MQTFTKLDRRFYSRSNTLTIARELIGKLLVTDFQQQTCVGRIVETEAYAGITDMASHARNGLRSKRTEVMYGSPGVAYIYFCYGIHNMFNVVTNREGKPHAILIRAVEPVAGIEWMLRRTGKTIADYSLTKGPGNVAKAFGLQTCHTGVDLLSEEIFLAKNGRLSKYDEIIATRRIGVEYAGNDALLPYRFILKNNPYVSGKKHLNQG